MTVDQLEREVRELKAQMTKGLEQWAWTVPVISLAPEPLELVREIPVVVQSTGDDFIATFYDANISATGDTDTDAVANLKDLIVAKFRLFDGMPPEKLGKEPTHQLAVLRTLIRRSA